MLIVKDMTNSIGRIIGYCCTCIAFYIGAGFATMQEVMQYEASYGSQFWIVIAVAAAIYLYTNWSFTVNGPYLKDIDIVHVHLFPSLYWVGFAKWLTRNAAPLVYTEHSTRNRRRENPILNKVDRIVYQHAYKHIIACSEKHERHTLRPIQI